MKIVAANKYWFLKRGAERYAFELREVFARHGHETIPFAMRDPRNEKTPWDKYFVSAVNAERVRLDWNGLRTAGRFLYSFEARKKFGELLDRAKPDVVHLHNIYHQISPSIIPEAKKRGLPVIMTAHDYAFIAPNYSLWHDGAICERTKPDRYWEAARHRCVKGSALAGALEAVEMNLHRLLKLWDGVDRIIAPSRFVKALLEEYGVAPERIVHLPHFVDASAWEYVEGGSYALYVGALSPEKGVATLIRAAALRPDVPVRIVGTGPEEHALKALAHGLRADNVQFVGFKGGEELRREYAGARFIVVPSEWYEVFGLIVLEAFASGKPVVASQIGALSELVEEGHTGLHCTAGDPEDLARAIGRLWDSPETTIAMGRDARDIVQTHCAPEQHYRALLDIYKGDSPKKGQSLNG